MKTYTYISGDNSIQQTETIDVVAKFSLVTLRNELKNLKEERARINARIDELNIMIALETS